MATLEDRLRRARAKVEQEKEQVSQERLQTAISIGTTLLSMFTGRRGVSKTDLNRAGSAARGFSRSSKESKDVDRAEETLETLVDKLESLNSELEAEVSELTARFDPQSEELETIVCRPRRSDIEVRRVSLLWTLA